jgi:hypothetical protein
MHSYEPSDGTGTKHLFSVHCGNQNTRLAGVLSRNSTIAVWVRRFTTPRRPRTPFMEGYAVVHLWTAWVVQTFGLSN